MIPFLSIDKPLGRGGYAAAVGGAVMLAVAFAALLAVLDIVTTGQYGALIISPTVWS